jgi:hypothetical protein
MSAKRRWLIEQARDEDGEPTGEYDREQLLACMEEVEHLLFMVGGMVAFTTERVEIGEIGGEPLAVSRRVIVDWTAFSPMVREQRAPDAVAAEVDVPAPDDDLTAREWNGAPDEDDEDDEDEEIDRSLTTVGDPRPDATL